VTPSDLHYGCILFDLDGTLLDTVPLIVASHQHAWTLHTGAPGNPARILATIGRPIEFAFDDADESLRAKMRESYLAHNVAHNDAGIAIFLGVPAMLDALRALGVRVGLVTSKRRAIMLRCLRLFELEDRFEVLVAKEDTVRHKPFPDPLQLAMERLGETDPSRILYVGDSIHDVMCARNAGIPAAMVDWTEMDRAELRVAAPEVWVLEADDLVRAALTGTADRTIGYAGGPGPVPAWRRLDVAFGPGSGRDEEVVFAAVRASDGRVAVVHGRGTPEGAFRLPSGGRSKAENLVSAVLREAAEELGAKAKVLSCAGLMEHRFDELPAFRSTLFVLDAGDEPIECALNEENDEVRWIDPAELHGITRRLMEIEGEWQGWGRFRAATTGALAEHLMSR
jgi:pyrophosphatase PpaX